MIVFLLLLLRFLSIAVASTVLWSDRPDQVGRLVAQLLPMHITKNQI